MRSGGTATLVTLVVAGACADEGGTGPTVEGPDYAPCRDRLFADCEGLACAEDAAAAERLDLFLDVLVDRGVRDRYEVLWARHDAGTDADAGGIEIGYVVVIDWYRAAGSVRIEDGWTGARARDWIEQTVCLDLPATILSFQEVLDTFSSCDARLEAAGCELSNPLRPALCELQWLAEWRELDADEDPCTDGVVSYAWVDLGTGEVGTCVVDEVVEICEK